VNSVAIEFAAGLLAPMHERGPMIAVCGAGSADPETMGLAEAVGYELARAGAIVVCGGLGGVMEGACAGAKRGGGLTVGILPGSQISAANPSVDVPIATGMEDGRNAIITHTAEAVIALRGSYGTLSEVALALKMGKPVCTIGDWCPIDNVTVYQTPLAAVQGTLAMLRARRTGRAGFVS
jgi:uncharacterized protein (TIGR00725 family)